MNNAKADRELIVEMNLDNESALGMLYSRYADRVFDLSFFLLKDTGWSEDVVQEVFFKLWVQRAVVDENSELWPYLYVLAKREALNKLRGLRRSKSAFERLLHHIELYAEETDKMLNRKELSQELESYVSQLPAQQQIVFTLSKLDGLSHQQIAEKLNLSKNTVKNHMAQALKHMRKNPISRDLLHILVLYFFFKK